MNNVEYPCIKYGKKYYLNNYFNIGANRSLKLVECPFCHKKNYVIANTGFSINKEKINQSKKQLEFFLKYADKKKYPNYSGRLYHFTDSRNLESIRQSKGLYSYRNLSKNKINTNTGGDEASIKMDNQLGLDKYIHLSFTSDSPMYYKVKNLNKSLKYLEIDISVVNQDGVIFCDKFATSNDAKFYDNIDPSVFHLDELYSGNVIDEKLKKEIASYEILMPDFIATDFIINL